MKTFDLIQFLSNSTDTDFLFCRQGFHRFSNPLSTYTKTNCSVHNKDKKKALALNNLLIISFVSLFKVILFLPLAVAIDILKYCLISSIFSSGSSFSRVTKCRCSPSIKLTSFSVDTTYLFPI